MYFQIRVLAFQVWHSHGKTLYQEFLYRLYLGGSVNFGRVNSFTQRYQNSLNLFRYHLDFVHPKYAVRIMGIHRRNLPPLSLIFRKYSALHRWKPYHILN